MSDSGRDAPDGPERVRETERTTVVQTGGRRGRGSGLLIALVLLVAVAALLFFLFGGGLNRAADEVGVNVNVEVPEIETPDVKLEVPDVEVPDVDLPKVEVEAADGAEAGNRTE